MADGTLLVLWKNHHSAFCDILSRLREKETFTDVTLACEGKFYPVHKLVLSACSEHLEKILESTKCRHPVIVLHGIKCSELESLLMFMYSGEVNVPQNSLDQLMRAAELLEVKGLAVPDIPQSLDSEKTKESKNCTDDNPPSKRRKLEEKSSEEERDSQAWSSPSANVSSTHTKERQVTSKHSQEQLERQEEEQSITENQAPDRTCVRETEAVHVETAVKEEVAAEEIDDDEPAMAEAGLNNMNPSFEKDEGNVLGNTGGSYQLAMSSSDLEHHPSVHPKQYLPHQVPTPDVMCTTSESKEHRVEGQMSEGGAGDKNSMVGEAESLLMQSSRRMDEFAGNFLAERNVSPYAEAFKGLNLEVLMRLSQLDQIVETQKHHTALLEILTSAQCSQATDPETIEDILEKPLDSIEELHDFCRKVAESQTLQNILVSTLTALTGQNVGDSVRRMLRKVGTPPLWSQFNMKGRRHKYSFEKLPLYKIILKACRRVHSNCQDKEIEFQIAETLKHSPSKPGGYLFQAHHAASKSSTNTTSPNLQYEESNESSG